MGVIVYFLPKRLKNKILFVLMYNFYLTKVGLFWHKRQLLMYEDKVKCGKIPPRKSKTLSLDGVTIYIIPYLTDNFAYLVVDNLSRSAVVVDPAGADEVMKVLNSTDAKIEGILCTHKHWDHAGGNGDMVSSFPNVPVYSSRLDSVYKVNHIALDGEHIQVGTHTMVALFTPGHTKGHMVYMLLGNDGRPPCLFTGDHLFVGGCGQIFECSPNVMLESLRMVSNLPSEALVFPGHDYALTNIQFVTRLAEPKNQRAQSKLKVVSQLASQLEPAVPSVLAEELEYNPFLRVKVPSVRASTGLSSTDATDSDVFLELRRMKARFSNQPVWY